MSWLSGMKYGLKKIVTSLRFVSGLVAIVVQNTPFSCHTSPASNYFARPEDLIICKATHHPHITRAGVQEMFPLPLYRMYDI